MIERLRVLVSSAGRRAELLNCLRSDAADLGIALELLATDMEPNLSAACLLADRSYQVPPCESAEFIGRMLDLSEAEGVDLIIPTIDTELRPYSDAKTAFRDIDTRVAVSDPEAVRIARDKWETAEFLRTNGVRVPRTANLKEAFAHPGDWQAPLIVKPRGGSSSVGIQVADSIDEIVREDHSADSIVQDLVVGREYTVNMFVDRRGNLAATVPHERIEVRSGEVSKGRTRRNQRLDEISACIAQNLPGVEAALCFQAIVDHNDDAWVFEINARFGGGFPLTHRAGAPFTRWLLEECSGRTPAIGAAWTEDVLMLRYDAAVFGGASR